MILFLFLTLKNISFFSQSDKFLSVFTSTRLFSEVTDTMLKIQNKLLNVSLCVNGWVW